MLIETGLPNTQGTAVVIEDDLDIRNLLCTILRQAGFDVHSSRTGREGVEAVRHHTPIVVTLDVGLPDIDGYEVLRRIRGISDCYVIMLTARSDEADTLTALHFGADGYLTKPFSPRELRARINAMLRRPRTTTPLPTRNSSPPTPPLPAPAPAPVAGSVPVEKNRALLCRGELVLDRDARTVWVAGQEVPLTKSEFDVLHELLRSNGAVRTRSMLVGIVRGEDYRGYSHISDADQRAVEVHVTNLRRKLPQHPGTAELIVTVRGVGYRIPPLPAVALGPSMGNSEADGLAQSIADSKARQLLISDRIAAGRSDPGDNARLRTQQAIEATFQKRLAALPLPTDTGGQAETWLQSKKVPSPESEGTVR